MRRDSIFYRLFAQAPTLLFDLIPDPPDNAADYRFDSIEIKETSFRLDGVFSCSGPQPNPVYFCEIQFQRDEQLYERLFSELFLCFYRQRERYSNWRAILIYPNRGTEQRITAPFEALLASPQVVRVYLDELDPNLPNCPIGLALMLLTTLEGEAAIIQARSLIARSRQNEESSAIVELISTIMVYKFTNLSREAVEQMLSIELKQTRVYQDAKEEGRQEGRQELLTNLLARRLGRTLPESVRSRLGELSIVQSDSLSEALFNFVTLEDLQSWLAKQDQ